MKKIALMIVMVGLLTVGLIGCKAKDTDPSKVDATKLVTLDKAKYTGIEATREAVEVTDQDIQDRINSVLDSNKTKTEVTDRAIQDGDVVNIDFVGKIDGKEFDGGSSKGYDLVIGSNSFIEGFESGLIGHNKGEAVSLNLTFPADYASKDYAGKNVVFDVTINTISTQSTPEFTDDFVKGISQDYKTTAEYTAYVKDSLQEEKETSAEQTLRYNIWDQVIANATVSEVPQSVTDRYYDLLNKTYEQYAAQTGMKLEDFLSSYYGMDMATYGDNLKKQAESMGKESLVISYIASKEKIDVTDEELQKEAENYATQYGYESVDAFLEATDKDALKETLMNEKVIDFVVDNAKITD